MPILLGLWMMAIVLQAQPARSVEATTLSEERFSLHDPALFDTPKAPLSGEGGVIINEFMYNPPDGYLPYVELFNSGDQAVNLQGWKLYRKAGDDQPGGTITDMEFILNPGEYVAVTPDTSLLTLLYGDLNKIEMELFPVFDRESGDQVRLLSGDGVRSDSLHYLPEEWGGKGVALERRRADLSSVFQENWAESTAENFGTPGRGNSAEPELPFTVSNIQVGTRQELFLTFNADLDPGSVLAGNFFLEEINPAEAELSAPHIIRLTFDRELLSGPHSLVTGMLQSREGWQISEGREFPFTVFDTYIPGDVIINEFMYDPPQGYPAYVELYNRSDKYLNLGNWKLLRKEISSGPGGLITTAALPLAPNGYLAVADSMELMGNEFGERSAVQMNGFPAFSSIIYDQIRLYDDNGLTADSLEFEPTAWGGRGVSLERKSAEVSAVYRENWAESEAGLLGTPGVVNGVQPDTGSPVLEKIGLHENRGFLFYFSKTVDPRSAAGIENYSFEPALSIQQVEAEGSEISIFLRQELQDGVTYKIRLEGVTDLFGNRMEPTQKTVTYYQLSGAIPGEVVINEMLVRRESAESPEFVELFNLTAGPIDLGGWVLSAGESDAVLPEGTVLLEHDYLVLTDSENFVRDSNRRIYLPGFPGLRDAGSDLVVRDRDGTVMDSLYYRPDWDVLPGISLERKDPEALSIDPANWGASRAGRGSTPAGKNSRFRVDMAAPEILFANLYHPDSLEVVFNKFIDLRPTDTVPGARFLMNGTEVPVLVYDPGRADRIIVGTVQVRPDAAVRLRAEGVRDFKGNVGTTSAEAARPPAPGDLVINEIMYHPLSNKSGEKPGQSEYLEIFNRKPYVLSLEGVYLHDEPDENLEVNRLDPVAGTHRSIPAGGYVLFYPEPEEMPLSESRTGVYFNLSEETDRFGMRIDRVTLGLTLDGRAVYLADSTQTVLDRVAYRPEWHNPNLISTRGISLERKGADLDSNNPSAWGSNTTLLGGTPVGRNSLYRYPGDEAGAAGIVLTPNPFSPDGDGMDDRLQIQYRFEDPNYMLKVRVYDRYGRLIRHLAENYPAGFDGALAWDGRSDAGETNRIGIYIVYVEAYNSSTGQKKVFRETAVLARQF